MTTAPEAAVETTALLVCSLFSLSWDTGVYKRVSSALEPPSNFPDPFRKSLSRWIAFQRLSFYSVPWLPILLHMVWVIHQSHLKLMGSSLLPNQTARELQLWLFLMAPPYLKTYPMLAYHKVLSCCGPYKTKNSSISQSLRTLTYGMKGNLPWRVYPARLSFKATSQSIRVKAATTPLHLLAIGCG